MSMTTISRGNALETTYIGITITPASVASFTSATQTFNVSGLLKVVRSDGPLPANMS